jgi:transcriptional regulator with XRE-family HTH domain
MRLGEFLRTRRARLSPADFGLPHLGRRRTPGLRREEVAQLSGISVAYYTWMEQGRDLHMSFDVLNALARTLHLSNAERTHLFTLADLKVPESVVVEDSTLHPTLAHLLETSPDLCAFTYDAWFNVVAATPLATSVFGMRPGRGAESNWIYHVFADPEQRCLWADWESEARILAGMFRQCLAKWPDATEGNALLEALKHVPDFTKVWTPYDVRLLPSPDEYFRAEPWELNHRRVGTLRIYRIALAVPRRHGGTILLCSPAEPKTASRFQELVDLGTARQRLSLVKA